MGIFFVRTKIISRLLGQSAAACASYRSGEKIFDAYYGSIRDYTRKTGIIDSNIELPELHPKWAEDRETLYSKIELTEDTSTRRKEAQLLREFIIAIPFELKGKSVELAQTISRDILVKEGMIADWSVHEPNPNGDMRNYHIHILTTMRKIDEDGFSKKERTWNTKGFNQKLKEKICTLFNNELFKSGFNIILDHRSYKEQGIVKEPTKHKGPKRTSLERKGAKIDIDNEIITEWNITINRRLIEHDVAKGYNVLAKAMKADTIDIDFIENWIKNTENKWISHICKSISKNGATGKENIQLYAERAFHEDDLFRDLCGCIKDANQIIHPKIYERDRGPEWEL